MTWLAKVRLPACGSHVITFGMHNQEDVKHKSRGAGERKQKQEEGKETNDKEIEAHSSHVVKYYCQYAWEERRVYPN